MLFVTFRSIGVGYVVRLNLRLAFEMMILVAELEKLAKERGVGVGC